MTEQIVTVRLVASLRARTKAKSLNVAVPVNAAARDVVTAIQQQQPVLAAYALDAQGQLMPGVLLLVNGRHIDLLQGLDTPVNAADDLLLMPPVAGG